MKTLAEGAKIPADWWVGKRTTCNLCDQQMELEAHDADNYPFKRITAARVETKCPNCGEPMPLVYLPTKSACNAESPAP